MSEIQKATFHNIHTTSKHFRNDTMKKKDTNSNHNAEQQCTEQRKSVQSKEWSKLVGKTGPTDGDRRVHEAR